MSRNLTRRDVFDQLRGAAPQLRPPWSFPDSQFTDHCTACGACIKACPAGLLTAGRGRYPIVDFTKGECTFCGACAESCPENLCFSSSRTQPAWNIRARIAQHCVEAKGIACRMCEDACLQQAITVRPAGRGRGTVVVAVERCTGCGACCSTCPVGAIGMAAELQEAVT